jgi:hypothetical protein
MSQRVTESRVFSVRKKFICRKIVFVRVNRVFPPTKIARRKRYELLRQKNIFLVGRTFVKNFPATKIAYSLLTTGLMCLLVYLYTCRWAEAFFLAKTFFCHDHSDDSTSSYISLSPNGQIRPVIRTYDIERPQGWARNGW